MGSYNITRMNQSIDFIDKSDFKCFKIMSKDGDKQSSSADTQQTDHCGSFQIYFGQVQYLRESDKQVVSQEEYEKYLVELEQEKKRVEELKQQQQNQKVDPKKQKGKDLEKTIQQDQIPEIQIDHIVIIRHGIGIQLIIQDDQCVGKYEGEWHNDMRKGKGKTVYKDGSYYEGNIQNGTQDDYGIYQWANGNSYEGIWKHGRIDGGGKFTHYDGNVLQGIFKNNLYMKQSDTFLNPFMNSQQIADFIQNKRYINKIKQQNYNKKLFFCEKVDVFKYQKVQELINKSISNRRVSIILSSKGLKLKKFELLKYLLIDNPNKINYEFDLRKAYCLNIEDPKLLDNYMQEIKVNLGNALIKGHNFIINIDDSEYQYEEIFDPDISKFYDPNRLPSQIWNYDEVTKEKVFEKVLNGTKNMFSQKANKEFKLIVWSKFKLNEELSIDILEEQFKQRFNSVVPVDKLDVILLCESNSTS